MKSSSKDKLQEAKRLMTIPVLWEKLKIPGRCSKMCKVPWRDDKRPSLSISKDGMLWHDFGEGTGGDAICFLEFALGISRRDACMMIIEMAGLRGFDGEIFVRRELMISKKPRQKPDIPILSAGTLEQRNRLAGLRKVDTVAVDYMVENGMLGFCDYKEKECWVITDKDGINAQARSIDGSKWGQVKAITLAGSWAKWPIGIGQSSDKVLFVEGGPDILAGWHYVLRHLCDWSVVGMFGSSMSIQSSAVPLFSGKKVRIIPHSDRPGYIAAGRWMGQLEEICDVEVVCLPKKVKDLNELVIATSEPVLVV